MIHQHFKRFFTFGCSFTNFVWPTWADIVANEMPNTKFYNFGLSGAGNPMISARVVEAHKRFQFDENDLVMVMFTSFYREDRYANGNWLPRGNVYNSDIYSKDFLQKYADPAGYLLRDFALIELVYNFLKNLPCKSMMFLSADANEDLAFGKLIFDNTDHDTNMSIVNLYQSTIDKFPTSLKNFLADGGGRWPIGYSYRWRGEIHNDSHPNPKMYLDYLKHLGINLSEKADIYVDESMDRLKLCLDKDDFNNVFPEMSKNTAISKTLLF